MFSPQLHPGYGPRRQNERIEITPREHRQPSCRAEWSCRDRRGRWPGNSGFRVRRAPTSRPRPLATGFHAARTARIPSKPSVATIKRSWLSKCRHWHLLCPRQTRPLRAALSASMAEAKTNGGRLRHSSDGEPGSPARGRETRAYFDEKRQAADRPRHDRPPERPRPAPGLHGRLVLQGRERALAGDRQGRARPQAISLPPGVPRPPRQKEIYPRPDSAPSCRRSGKRSRRTSRSRRFAARPCSRPS